MTDNNNNLKSDQHQMDSGVYIQRLNMIEDELRETRKYRHDRNEAFSTVLDEIRIKIMDQDEEIKELRGMHKEVIDALRGVMGRSGLIDEHVLQDSRIKKLEDWQRDIKAFITGALAICSVVSAGLTAGISYLLHYLKS